MTPLPDMQTLFTARVRAEGCTNHVVVYEPGLTIGSRPGRGRLVTWTEIMRLADGPPADRYGVVINGRLTQVFEDECDAQNAAADQRTLGVEAAVIKVPVSLTT